LESLRHRFPFKTYFHRNIDMRQLALAIKSVCFDGAMAALAQKS
jgi:hypothetical protein